MRYSALMMAQWITHYQSDSQTGKDNDYGLYNTPQIMDQFTDITQNGSTVYIGIAKGVFLKYYIALCNLRLIHS